MTENIKKYRHSLRHVIFTTSLVMAVLFSCSSSDPEPEEEVTGPPAVQKTNSMKVYMHYMPWFQSKPFAGYWGSHWTMTNRNPDIVDANGQRQIASHYYPLIGPYDSRDKDVIDYHLLLMKYAGVDGLLIDWYGTHSVYDYKVNATATHAVVTELDSVGLQFGVVYEDYTAQNVEAKTNLTAVEAAQADMKYLNDNYYPKKNHIAIDGKPLLLTFGPRYFKTASQWTEIFKNTQAPVFLPLWDHASLTGSTGGGEFSWVDFNASLSQLTTFYGKASSGKLKLGSAYPRFHDFYAEGGTGTSYGYVDFNNGQTLQNTLNKAAEYDLKYLQLVTWNDFGEGTILEPTVEDQFKCLEILQAFTGVSYTKAELELVYSYYLKKIKYKGNPPALATLKQIFQHLVNLEVDQARTLLDSLE